MNPKKCHVEDVRREDGWWLLDPNNVPEYREVGPYDTKDEARDAARGLTKFWKRNPQLLGDPTKS